MDPTINGDRHRTYIIIFFNRKEFQAVFYEPFAFDDEEKEKYLIAIFEEQEGDLTRRRKSGLLTEEAASNIYVKVTSDLIWLHSMQLIHGDIKPRMC